VQPWRAETFKFSTDPELVAKVTDVVGLYLAPPQDAVVLCVDEKSQILALDRTAPMLPMQPGLPERRTADYVRHGTTTLFAALEIATGKVTGACQPRHLWLGTRAQRQDPRLHRRLERPPPPVRLDQDRRPDPGESEPSEHFRNGALAAATPMDAALADRAEQRANH
jgi:transposase